ncbi:hypothetical protein ACFWUZ_29560 [Streptomyces sp. NPDC058646]|uniref:hypothetical protein n=1 Tax=Streptomyces sp. NPDC058646 TaxID=3346574 RepID=UPI003653F2EF
MNTVALALVVSTASATFTALGLSVTYATFKRARPRVKLKVTWDIEPGRVPFSQASPEDFRHCYHVRVINKGAATVVVDEVKALLRFPGGKAHLFDPAHHPSPPPPLTLGVVWIDGQERMQVGPFGEARWMFSQPFTLEPTVMHGIRFRATLSNGRTVKSRWLSVHRMLRREQRSRTRLVDLQRLMGEGVEQLTFDDLEKEGH